MKADSTSARGHFPGLHTPAAESAGTTAHPGRAAAHGDSPTAAPDFAGELERAVSGDSGNPRRVTESTVRLVSRTDGAVTRAPVRDPRRTLEPASNRAQADRAAHEPGPPALEPASNRAGVRAPVEESHGAMVFASPGAEARSAGERARARAFGGGERRGKRPSRDQDRSRRRAEVDRRGCAADGRRGGRCAGTARERRGSASGGRRGIDAELSGRRAVAAERWGTAGAAGERGWPPRRGRRVATPPRAGRDCHRDRGRLTGPGCNRPRREFGRETDRREADRGCVTTAIVDLRNPRRRRRGLWQGVVVARPTPATRPRAPVRAATPRARRPPTGRLRR